MWLINIISFLTRFYVRQDAGTRHFVETYEYETGFAEHYKKLIQPYVQQYENKRIKALDGARIRFFICVMLAPYVVLVPTVLLLTRSATEYDDLASLVLFFSLCFMSIYTMVFAITRWLLVTFKKATKDSVIFKRFRPFLLFSLIIYGCALIYEPIWSIICYPIIVWGVVCLPIESYKNDVKETIFPNIVSFMGGYRYEHKSDRDVAELKGSRILPKFDKESNEDHFLGKYKGVNIDLFETELKKRDETVFKGLVVCLSMQKGGLMVQLFFLLQQFPL